MLIDTVTLTLAQDTGADAPPPPPTYSDDVADSAEGQDGAPLGPADGAQPRPTNGFGGMLFPLILIMGVFFIIMMSSSRREKKRRAEMLSQLGKGKKVRTAGGVLGTVVEVRDDEVLVKVDESANTRIRFARDAITAVMDEKE